MVKKRILKNSICGVFLSTFLFGTELKINYNLDVYFHPRTDQTSGFIEGVNHVRIVNNSHTELKELYFHNAGNHDPKHAPLSEISSVRCSHGGKVSGQDSLVLIIGLFPPVQAGETVIVDIPFKTYFTSSGNPSLPTYGSRKDTVTYNAIHYYPILEYFYSDGWHPDEYGKTIKPHSNFAKYEMDLTAPTDFLVGISSSISTQTELETGHTKYKIKDNHTLSSSAVFIKGMQKYPLNISGIQIEIIAQKSQEKHVKNIQARLEKLIPFYEKQFGNALMDKLVISSGYSIGSRAITTSNYIIFQDKIDDGHVFDHELAHQWFGFSIQADAYAENWLNESFAEYASWLFERSQKVKPDPFTFTKPIPDLNIWPEIKAMDMEDWTQFLLDVIGEKSLPPIYRPGKQTNWENAANIYSKYIVGSHALQMLQASEGDSVMQIIMMDYSMLFRGKTANTEDFINIIKKHTDDKIADNFRLALTTNLQLDFKIEDVTSQYKINRLWNNKINTKYNGSWILPVDVLIITENGDSTLMPQMDINRNNTIEITTSSQLVSAELDPNKLLFDDNRFNNRWPRRISLQPDYGLPHWETYKVYYRPKLKRDWRGNWRTGVKLSGGLGINLMPIMPAFYQNLFDLEITFSTGVPEYNWGGKVSYKTPLKSTVNTYWELETGYEYPKKWTKIAFNNYIGEPKYLAVHGESSYSRLTTTFSNTEYISSDSSDWWPTGRNIKLKEKWSIFSYTTDQRYLLEVHFLGGFQEEVSFYNFGISADVETHKIEGFIIRFHSEAGFVWDERGGNELSYRLLYIPKIWQQREGQIPLFRGVSIIEKEWQNNIFSNGISVGWETKTVAWPMVFIDGTVVSNEQGTLLDRMDYLNNSGSVYLTAGVGLESQTMMEVGLYFPIWVSHPIRGEDNFALRMLMQWGFYF